MMPHLTFSLPPAALRVNAGLRSHGLAYHRAAVSYRERVGMEALTQEREWKGRVCAYPLKLTICVSVAGNRTVDTVDAASWCKVLIDELVTLGVWPDDSDRYLNPIITIVERVKRPSRARVELWWQDAEGRV